MINLKKLRKKKALWVSVIVTAVLILTVQSAMATTFSGGRPSAVFKAFYDSSVSSYGYGPHYDAARANWNVTSGSVDITTQSNTNNYPDKYYVGTATNPPGKCNLGVQVPYKKNWLGSIVGASNSDTWLYSTVTIYHNSMTDCVSMDYAEKVSNATHEVGHSLGLDHPSSGSASSVMQQGVQSIGPTTYDKNDIIAKWGP